jgi:hypothetical protein
LLRFDSIDPNTDPIIVRLQQKRGPLSFSTLREGTTVRNLLRNEDLVLATVAGLLSWLLTLALTTVMSGVI